MRRLTEYFEDRVVKCLCGMLSIPEQGEIDYEITPTPFPFQQADGTMGLGMGMNVALAVPTLALGDHVLVTGLIQDPYSTDSLLETQVGELLAGLRKMRAEANSITNGGLAVVPGARR